MCFSYIGLGIRKYYTVRSSFYTDCVRFIETLQEEISYLKSPLTLIIDMFCEERKGEFVKTLTAYKEVVASGSVNTERVSKCLPAHYLTSAEKEVLTTFLTSLGKLDAPTQLQSLANYKQRISLKQETCEKLRTTYGTLAFRLGVLAGILAMILIA